MIFIVFPYIKTPKEAMVYNNVISLGKTLPPLHFVWNYFKLKIKTNKLYYNIVIVRIKLFYYKVFHEKPRGVGESYNIVILIYKFQRK